MNHQFISDVMSIGGGFLIGVLIGYFLRKILKLVLFALGGILSLLVYLQYQGLITMNMDKVQNIADKIIATLPNSISVITQAQNQFNSSTINMNDLVIPFTGSMAVGITAGFSRG